MFGQTKKQFLKRSSKCLDETGSQALLMRGLVENEVNGTIDKKEAYNQIKHILKEVERIFFDYEDLNSPPECVSLHLKILNCLIILQDAVAANYDYINVPSEEKADTADEKLEKSKVFLERFRNEFRPLTIEVDNYLQK